MENSIDFTERILTNLSYSNKAAIFIVHRGEAFYPTRMELVGLDNDRFSMDYLRRVATHKTRKLLERRNEIWEEFHSKYPTVAARRTYLSANLTFNLDKLTALHFWFNPLDDDSHIVCVERERTWERHHCPIILDADSRSLYAYDDRGWRKDSRTLSPVQMKVAALLAKGKSNKEIAQELHVAEATVAYHKHSIFEKFGVASSGAATHIMQALTVPPLESSGMLANESCTL